MKKSLIIVESPSKAKTITKYLGANFIVKASIGHIWNLPEDRFGVDIENGFAPQYEIIPGKKKTITELKKAAKEVDTIYIATDPDREGEAIAWHIAQEIGTQHPIYRAMFYEITQNAVQKAIQNPVTIDNQKVSAQQARRVLDRIVGYTVSPIIWKVLSNKKLSAGRVQSAALRLVCEREEKVRAFVPEEYWTIHVILDTPKHQQFKALLVKCNGKTIKIPNETTAYEIIQDYKDKPFSIDKIAVTKVSRKPLPPFITSTLQQEASSRLGFTPARTMLIAQQLYEGVALGAEGHTGLITYMRTDSTRISTEAIAAVREYIENTYGSEYLPPKPVEFISKSKGKVQGAHECIRPTYLTRKPDSLKKYLTAEQYKLYSLIWNRFIACQMKPALFEQTTVTITAGSYEFHATGSVPLFQGFLKIWEDTPKTDHDEEDDTTTIPPGLTRQTPLTLISSDPKQHFTKAPARYSESTLVKELEQLGIGRPSTFAYIISTLLDRQYAIVNKKRLYATKLGETVNKFLMNGFPNIVDIGFTAQMETELDQIESGAKAYLTVVKDFYEPFNKNLSDVKKNLNQIRKTITEKAPFPCEICGKDMILKWSSKGGFYACSGYPDCKNTKPLSDTAESAQKTPPEKAGFTCEKCGNDMLIRIGKHGKFYACSGYPQCKNTKPFKYERSTSGGEETRIPPESPEQEMTSLTCEKCGKKMVLRYGKRGKFYACSGYPQCKNTKPYSEKTSSPADKIPPEQAGFTCDKCGKPMVIRSGKFGSFYACSGYPQCKNTRKFGDTIHNSSP